MVNKNMVVFSTPTCSWCRKLKTYLNQNRIHFKDVDVSRDMKAAQIMVRKTRQQGVPQMSVNNYPVVGFDKIEIDRLLNIIK